MKKKKIIIILVIFPAAGNNWKKKILIRKNEKFFGTEPKMGYCPFEQQAGRWACWR